MARFSILLFLAVSFFVAIASPIDPNKYTSIALSKKANELYQTYKRLKLAAALNKNHNNEMAQIMTNQAREAKQQARAAYKEAQTQMKADLDDAQLVIYTYDSQIAYAQMDRDYGVISSEEYAQRKRLFQSKVDKYHKYVKLIKTAFKNIASIETPKASAPGSSGHGSSRSDIQAAAKEIVPVEEVVPVQEVVPVEAQAEAKSSGKIKSTINSLRRGIEGLVQKVKNSKSSGRNRSFGGRIRGSNSGSSSDSN